MIGLVKGTVAYQAAEYCLIETAGGVGYRVFMPVSQLRTLAMGQEVKVLTYTAVREDAIQLYGFLTRQYYDLFTLLLSVSGVGPKGALGILGSSKPEEFYLAVQSRDLKMLTTRSKGVFRAKGTEKRTHQKWSKKEKHKEDHSASGRGEISTWKSGLCLSFPPHAHPRQAHACHQ